MSDLFGTTRPSTIAIQAYCGFLVDSSMNSGNDIRAENTAPKI